MEIEISSLAELEVFAAKLAALVQPGQIYLLNGDLGAGKTTFVSSVIQHLAPQAQVSSPTFTLINKYAGSLPIYHLDLYRLENEAAIEHLALPELLENQQSVFFIEWAEKLGKLRPPQWLELTFSYPTVTSEPAFLSTEKRLIKIQHSGHAAVVAQCYQLMK